MQPKPWHGGIFTSDRRLSLPKAEGANAIVHLGVTSQVENKKEKAEGRRASVWRHNQEAQGE